MRQKANRFAADDKFLFIKYNRAVARRNATTYAARCRTPGNAAKPQTPKMSYKSPLGASQRHVLESLRIAPGKEQRGGAITSDC